MEKAVCAFEKTGIHPFNRNIFSEDDFAPSEETFCPNQQEDETVAKDSHESGDNGSSSENTSGAQNNNEQPRISPADLSPLSKVMEAKKNFQKIGGVILLSLQECSLRSKG